MLKTTIVTVCAVVASTASTADAAAQSHIEAVPSVTIGTIYDDNLFAQVEGDAGEMLLVRPGLGTAIDTPRLSLSSLFTFDSQHSNHRDLTMIDARRHGDATFKYRTSPMTTIGFMAQYDRTETPGEINIGTGILSERRQAQRWEVSPNFARRLAPHTSITGSYMAGQQALHHFDEPGAVTGDGAETVLDHVGGRQSRHADPIVI